MTKPKALLSCLLALLALHASAAPPDPKSPSQASGKRLKLAFITCSVEGKFFEPLKRGMQDAAEMLDVDCVFMGTTGVDLPKQAAMIRSALAEGYDGIAVNLIDADAFDDAVAESIERGVPVVAFNVDDSASPNARLSSVNQNLYEAGRSLALHVAGDIPQDSQVLMTMHDEGVSALEDRLRGMQDVLQEKRIRWKVEITGNDAVRGAEVVADALRQNPDIRIVLGTGQSDTEAAGRAIAAHFSQRDYWSAGFDLSPETLRLIQAGTIRCTVDQQPYTQGFYPVVQLVLNLRYGIVPSNIDAGAAIIDQRNVDQVLELTKQGYR